MKLDQTRYIFADVVLISIIDNSELNENDKTFLKTYLQWLNNKRLITEYNFNSKLTLTKVATLKDKVLDAAKKYYDEYFEQELLSNLGD